jgi:hypothetical protein
VSLPSENSTASTAPTRGERRVAVAGGCLAALGSAVLTCLLLFVNGSLVLAILDVLDGDGMRWLDEQGLSQFLLFVVPVALVVIQWLMIDYVRTRFSSRHA